jgi:hypothetical protein
MRGVDLILPWIVADHAVSHATLYDLNHSLIVLLPLCSDSACPGEKFRMAAMDSNLDVLCNTGYEGLKCSDCALRYFKSAADTCVPCPASNDESKEAEAFTKAIFAVGFMAGTVAMALLVALYLKEDNTPQVQLLHGAPLLTSKLCA